MLHTKTCYTNCCLSSENVINNVLTDSKAHYTDTFELVLSEAPGELTRLKILPDDYQKTKKRCKYAHRIHFSISCALLNIINIMYSSMQVFYSLAKLNKRYNNSHCDDFSLACFKTVFVEEARR